MILALTGSMGPSARCIQTCAVVGTVTSVSSSSGFPSFLCCSSPPLAPASYRGNWQEPIENVAHFALLCLLGDFGNDFVVFCETCHTTLYRSTSSIIKTRAAIIATTPIYCGKKRVIARPPKRPMDTLIMAAS